jgi:hypothetical protein
VYPIPTLEENIHRFHQAKVFSSFDIKDAFQTIQQTKESSMLTTMHMHTPWGSDRWTHLPFGIRSAPEEFQRGIHDVLCGLDGIINIPDDIIVMSRGDYLQAATGDHDQSLLELLKRLTWHKLTLNPDKITFKSHTAPFVGHILTPDGLKPSAQVAKAIHEMPQPVDKAATRVTRRFLDTVTYLFKCCLNLIEMVRPLRDLTLISNKNLSGQTNTLKHLERLNNWSLQLHASATLIYTLRWYSRMMLQIIALVPHYFNLTPNPRAPVTLTCTY